jgi:hypothetical protein
MRTKILNDLISLFGYETYLEIGVGNGQNFEEVRCSDKVSVDPGGGQDGGAAATFVMTSDEFFSQNTRLFDLIFIDGLHHSEVVFRDICNALAVLNPGGIIVCHDLNPTCEIMQRVPRSTEVWTGDCWRAWLKVKQERPDLRMFVLETDFGVGIIQPGAAAWPAEPAPTPVETISFTQFIRHKSKWLPLIPAHRLQEGVGKPPHAPAAIPAQEEWGRYLDGLPEADRPFLVYCPTLRGDHYTDFTAEGRKFDVAFNDYSGCGEGMEGAEWQFSEKGHKWQMAARNLRKIPVGYAGYAFLDNDIEISVPELNAVFEIGCYFGFDIFQAAVGPDSITNHPQLKPLPNSLVRRVPFVEIMMPFFSYAGLKKCAHTFADSESGWGLDMVWPLYTQNMGLVDAVQAHHTRPVTSTEWRLSHGMTAEQEMKGVVAKHRALLGFDTSNP